MSVFKWLLAACISFYVNFLSIGCCLLFLLGCSSFSYPFLIMFWILGKLVSAYVKYVCYELEMISCCLISSVEAISSVLLNVRSYFCACVLLPLLGEPFNGQLVTEGRSAEEGEEKERNEEKEDLHGAAPEIFTSEAAQPFPVRHPDRFSSHHPDNLVPPAPQPPRRSRDHNWKQLGTTECSTTCGKGELVYGIWASLQIPKQGMCGGPKGHGWPCQPWAWPWDDSLVWCWVRGPQHLRPHHQVWWSTRRDCKIQKSCYLMVIILQWKDTD